MQQTKKSDLNQVKLITLSRDHQRLYRPTHRRERDLVKKKLSMQTVASYLSCSKNVCNLMLFDKKISPSHIIFLICILSHRKIHLTKHHLDIKTVKTEQKLTPDKQQLNTGAV